jgi:hypothetical protein
MNELRLVSDGDVIETVTVPSKQALTRDEMTSVCAGIANLLALSEFERSAGSTGGDPEWYCTKPKDGFGDNHTIGISYLR